MNQTHGLGDTREVVQVLGFLFLNNEQNVRLHRGHSPEEEERKGGERRKKEVIKERKKERKKEQKTSSPSAFE